LERRHRAPAGRRLQRHRAPVPADRAGRRRRAPAPRPAPAERSDARGRALVRRPDHDRARRRGTNAIGLVYVAAFGLDEGESIGALLEAGPPPAALANLSIDDKGFAWLPQDDFVAHFAADVDPVQARVMHAVQQPVHTAALAQAMGAPAWKSLPTWYMVAENDEAIPPDGEHQFAQRMGATTVEVPSSHVPMVSHPDAVVELIETAAAAVPVAAA
jgi:hypothetical protein